MPTDLKKGPKVTVIQVRDRAGTGLPFSKGLMSTSILATGIETELAYSIAAEIEQELRNRRYANVEADELAEIATRNLERRAGSYVAARYRAWRKAKRSGRPVIIALGGVPGVGKSTIATRLAVRLGITQVVTTDTIREVLRTVIPETVLAELHTSTYERVPEIHPGEPLAPSFPRQARAVAAAATAVATRAIKERRNLILEGVHLIPGKLRSAFTTHLCRPIVVEFLLVLQDEELHRAFLTHRIHGEPARGGERHLQHFGVIRELQSALREMAAKAVVPEHDVSRPEDLAQHIVDEVVQQVETVHSQELIAQ